jgi:hypothetical protein
MLKDRPLWSNREFRCGLFNDQCDRPDGNGLVRCLFPVRWRINLNDADAIQRMFPLDYGKGLLFLVHREFLPVQSPRGFRLPSCSRAVGLLQGRFIVSEGLNIAPDAFDKSLCQREWRPFRQARRLGGDCHVFVDCSQYRCVAVHEFDRVSHNRYRAHEPVNARSSRNAVNWRTDLSTWIDGIVKDEGHSQVRIEEGDRHPDYIILGHETVGDVPLPCR